MNMQQVLSTTMMVVVLFTTLTTCDAHGKNDSDSSKFMMDPTANYEWFVKVGDMTVMKKEFKEKREHMHREKRATLRRALLWENGVIPYTFAEGKYRDDEIAEITRAMAHYEEHTCLRFKPRTDEPDYIGYFKLAGCQSFIGKALGKQGVSLTSSCIREFSTIVHEIGHAIGLVHEQSRPDRDQYIDVLYENVYNGFERQFQRHDADDVDTLGVGYDYNSIMHYDHDTYNKYYGDATIVALNDPSIIIGRATKLSKLDVIKINTLYKCPGDPSSTDGHPPKSTIYTPPTPVPPPAIPFSCGVLLDDKDALEGMISSPGYPNYERNQDCQWQIRSPEGYQLRLNVISFGVQESAGCEDGYVEIYEKLDCTGYRLARLCLSYHYRLWYTFKNIGCIRYHTGSASPRLGERQSGFKLNFLAEDIDECRFGYCQYPNLCKNNPGGYQCSCPQGYFLSGDGETCFDVNECALEGHMCDHECRNFGGYYKCVCPDGSLQEGDGCTSVPSPIVNNCLINYGGCSQVCTFDGTQSRCSCDLGYVLQQDGHTCVLYKFHILNLPAIIQADDTVPTLTVSVSTPATTPTEKIPDTVPTVKVTSPTTIPTVAATECPPVNLPEPLSCSEVLTADSGTFTSRNWPNTYNVNEVCEWIIHISDCSKGIMIEFDSFSLAGKMPECAKDQVIVKEGIEEDSKSYGPLCHTSIPAPITLSSNVARVVMSAGPAHGKRKLGFSATYRVVDL